MDLYKHVGVAVAFSPRLHALLAEAAFHAPHFGSRLSLVHAGEETPEKERQLREALGAAGLAVDTPILWAPGAPDEAILRAVEQHQIDLLLAGALEKERPLRYYLGSVAHNLVREAASSLVLFTEPSPQPEPLRRIVVVTDYSEGALVAFVKALRFAAEEEAEVVHVVRVLSEYGEAMVLSEGVRRERAQAYQQRTLAEEQALLTDFVAAAGHLEVPVALHVLEGHGGLVVTQFARERAADLLVMPSASRHSHFFERLFPSDMEWVLREIPCNMWVARERLQ